MELKLAELFSVGDAENAVSTNVGGGLFFIQGFMSVSLL